MGISSDPVDTRRHAGWLPEQSELEEWLAGRCDGLDARADQPLHPVVAEFRDLIDADPIVRMYLNQMISQIPQNRQYSKRHLRSVSQLLRLIDDILSTAPEYGESMVMTPLGAVLDWTMGTPAGFAAYRDRRINAKLKKILNAWCEFLDSPGSLYVLNDSPSGWMSEAAARTIGIEQFQYDPADEHWGFRSWNDFFTRRFKEDARPVAAPDDDSVIVSACESTPYGISVDVQRQDRFWIKSQPYSLQEMLAGDEAVDAFVGGTVYQAFLSATDYHRWHSPVSGTIVRAFRVDGTYYSEADSLGEGAVEPANSQSYLAHVATRAIILIEADNPAIGLMAVVQVGMSDVSSCVIRPDLGPGSHLAKGDELGHFQFGGSTYCLVFRPGVIADFAVSAIPQPHETDPPVVRVRSRLATVRTPD
ncbi:phosphatidylserine decarboxylase family protein [Actinocatenispora sera]|uniref:Phosphatidylserine decarboxylase n=1 Tax=Actinocatenispora sera TaxID=390989 RepID=A0A810LB81_9ACTN|nr:phosphatidylserine decarboxylase family protein [Actinocatenispora sera]BCJ31832.1 phosphatidylserine decarboxylase [Actinocatenispora sera]